MSKESSAGSAFLSEKDNVDSPRRNATGDHEHGKGEALHHVNDGMEASNDMSQGGNKVKLLDERENCGESEKDNRRPPERSDQDSSADTIKLANDTCKDEGNDRVTLDEAPKQPLTTALSQEQGSKPLESTRPATPPAEPPKVTFASPVVKSPSDLNDPPRKDDSPEIIPNQKELDTATSLSRETPAAPVEPSVNSSPPVIPSIVTQADRLAELRAPLTDLYGPYIAEADACLADARNRLQTAIQQTRLLRQAFTERVYAKYRVCLRPPEPTDQIIQNIKTDPHGHLERLAQQVATIKEEKEAEKKEASKLNSELNSSMAQTLNVENAEQLMYLTAGLSLIILPEESVDESLIKNYSDRSPINTVTGQRVRAISQAAAAAGEVMLDRKRKATAMRVERQRRKQLQLLSGESAEPTSSLLTAASSVGSSIFKKPETKPPPTKPPPKGSRGRTPTSLPTNALLSLNPNAEEIKAEGKSFASTAALIARGVGSWQSKSRQDRLRHPHPESLGGRRRSNNSVQEPFSQSNLVNTLPPLPAPKERLERKPLPTIQNACTPRALESVDSVLRLFADDNEGKQLRGVSRIDLLNGLRKASREKPPTNPTEEKSAIGDPPQPDSPIDPVIVFSVLHTIGLVGKPPKDTCISSFELPPIREDDHIVATPHLKALHSSLMSSSCAVTQHLCSLATSRTQEASTETEGPPLKKHKPNEEIAVINIRGGGKMIHDASENDENSEAASDKRKHRKTSDPESWHSGEAVERIQSMDSVAHPAQSQHQHIEQQLHLSQALNPDVGHLAFLHPQISSAAHVANAIHGYQTPPERFHQTQLELSMTNQLRRMHHPAGDLAEYLGGPTALDLSSLMAGNAATAALAQQTSLAALGLARHPTGIMGYTLQDRTVAAHSMLLREQHAAALIANQHSLAQSLGSFSHVTNRSSAMPTLMGNSSSLAEQQVFHGSMRGQSKSPPQPAPRARKRSDSGSLGHEIRSRKPSTDSERSSLKDEMQHRKKAGQRKDPPTTAVQMSKAKVVTSQPIPAKKRKAPAEPEKEPVKSNEKDPVKSNEVEDTKEPASEKKLPTTSLPPPKPSAGNPSTATKAAVVDDEPAKRGMSFFKPAKPECVSDAEAESIQKGNINQVLVDLNDQAKLQSSLDYLLSLGAAIPIPRALVVNPLKDRLNTPGFKNSGSSGAPPVPRDIVVACILVWLWANHENTFQEVFVKSGRIDVDLECKWLIQAAVDTSIRDLTLEIAESMAKGEGPFAEAALARKTHASKSTGTGQSGDSEKAAATKKVETHSALIVSRALTNALEVCPAQNKAIYHYNQLLEYLDEVRLGALRARSYERTLLAAVVSRKAMMNEPFSYAYVSALVRAGEALGHENLYETTQDQDVLVSTMLPNDILADEEEAWEDPARPDKGFAPNLTGEDLMRRAHARAMVHKALRKLQDRHNIRDGCTSHGAYSDQSTEDTSSRPETSRTTTGLPSPRSGLKRRLSFLAQPPVPPGTGSAPARRWSVYDPKHFSEPLVWDPNDIENRPYGQFPRGERSRSFSLSFSARSGEPRSTKKTKRSFSFSAPLLGAAKAAKSDENDYCSTREIDWVDVAGIFQSVELPRKSLKTSKHEVSVPVGSTIFAPSCRLVNDDFLTDESEVEEEDLSETSILARHQIVLDRMKTKLTAYLDARKQNQDRRRSKSKK